MQGVKRYEVRLAPHNDEWAREFQRVRAEISDILGDNAIEIHHIGSTSIHGIFAKPILDVGISVENIKRMNIEGMERVGYICMGEHGIPGRCYFVKRREGEISTHHIHCFDEGHQDLCDLILFRDYLNAHPDCAGQYSALKRKAAEKYAGDRGAYQDEKAEFIQMVLSVARAKESNG